LAVKPADQRRRERRPPAIPVAGQQHRGQSLKPVKRVQHLLLARAGRITSRKLPDNDGDLRVCSIDPPGVSALATLKSQTDWIAADEPASRRTSSSAPAEGDNSEWTI